jgi:sulfite exporter TauE/SafE
VISYTTFGAVVGAIGNVISLSQEVKGFIQLFAGVSMMIMGLNMLSIFPSLRKFAVRMPRIFATKISSAKHNKKSSSFIIGLLNGLMPCGALQAMQLYALSTGSILEGALSMMVFALGTVPLMFGIGAISSLLSKKLSTKFVTIGAVMVVVLGISLTTNGLTLTRFPSFSQHTPRSQEVNIALDEQSANSTGEQESRKQEQVVSTIPVKVHQTVHSTLESSEYPKITVQVSKPVKWYIDAPEGSINGCNNKLLIPDYQIEYEFKDGENLIEFTPSKTGTIKYSCWMGMIRSTITVVDDQTPLDRPEESESEVDGNNNRDK